MVLGGMIRQTLRSPSIRSDQVYVGVAAGTRVKHDGLAIGRPLWASGDAFAEVRDGRGIRPVGIGNPDLLKSTAIRSEGNALPIR